MRISLIAMDLDGTTLQADREHFSPRLLAALTAAHKQGVAAVPITGRQYELLPAAIQTGAAWENLCVLCNGGQIRRLTTGGVLKNWPLPAEVLPPLIAMAKELELSLEFSIHGELYLTAADWERERQWPKEDLAFHVNVILPKQGRVIPSLLTLCNQEIEKINLVCIPSERREEIALRLAALPISGAWSGTHSMELSHPMATKANGLRSVCQYLGIPMEETMAIGDSGNDITMLQAAGLGVAVENAPAEVREAADVVTKTNLEDGAALAIERFVLSLESNS